MSAPVWVARGYHNPSLLLCLAVLGWSGNFVVGRLAHATIPPVALALARWLVASALIAPLTIPRIRADSAALRRHWRPVLGLSVTGVAVFNTLVYRGLQTTTAINGLLLQSITPVFIILAGFAVYRTRPRASELAGLVVSLLGVWIVVNAGQVTDRGGLRAAPGDLWILLAVASYAIYTVILRHRPPVHPLSLLGTTFAVGSILLVPFAVVEALNGDRLHLDGATLATVGYVGVVPSIVSYFCYNRGVELAGAARAGQFLHLMPVFGAVLAFIFLGERLQIHHLLGAAVIAAGLLISARRYRS